MKSPYDAATRLARTALSVRGDRACALPPLLVLTDPLRQPDPVALAGALPPGSGLIYRHFGHADRLAIATATVAMGLERGVVVLVSSDLELAIKSEAAGVHWPERMISQAARARARGCGMLFSGSAHGPTALCRANRADLDAVLVSTVFPSVSPSAGRAMGPMALAAWSRRTSLPVYALGGVRHTNAGRLNELGMSGIAVVGAIRSAGPTRT